MALACEECGLDRARRWEQMAKANGLTEADWPKPKPPEFRSKLELALHRRLRHGRSR